MDVTFEDVAMVIQDARYQQAITNFTEAQPDRAIRAPKKFDVEKFIQENNITLQSFVREPLGRWFLEKYADVEDAGNGRMVRNKKGRVHSYLNCMEEVYEARKRDPANLIPLDDLVRILEKYLMEDLFNQALVNGKVDVSFDQLRQQYDAGKDALDDSEDEKQWDSSYTDPNSYSESLEDDGGISVRTTILDKEKRTFNASEELRLNTQNETVEVTEKGQPNLAKQTISMNPTMSQAEAAAVTLNALNRYHSSRSMNINKVLDTLFEDLCRPLFDELMSDTKVKETYCKMKSFTLKPVLDKDMRYHRLLGQGAFGSVYGCMISQIGTMMAMKIMVKKKVKYKKAKNQVKAERDALRALAEHPSPYCMQLRYAYETAENYHLVIPLAIGGDLKYHLRGEKKFDLDRARVYSAEIAFGLGHLHELGMIMRDLKPRNVLLDSDGHCKISDFGLVADISSGKAVYGRAGTEGYWSPEVISGKGYSIDADWWSYGCCVFELLAGFNPFSTKHTKLPTRNDGTRSGKVKFPSNFPAVGRSLVTRLLNMDPKERLGCHGEGLNEVLRQNDPFWKPLDLQAVKAGHGPILWKPKPGIIYALNQHEMLDNDEDANVGANIRKLKLTPEDIVEFDYYVDMENHQRDVIKVIPPNTNIPRLREDEWDANFVPRSESGCCSLQ